MRKGMNDLPSPIMADDASRGRLAGEISIIETGARGIRASGAGVRDINRRKSENYAEKTGQSMHASVYCRERATPQV